MALEAYTWWPYIGSILAFLVGMATGSYATMPYYRLPKGIPCAGKWVGEKSACTVCGAQLRTRDLLPVFNWLITRGKCYNCGTRVDPIYFYIEASLTLLSVLLFLVHGFSVYYFVALVMCACHVIITASDLRFKHIDTALLVVLVMMAFLRLSPDDFYDVVYQVTASILVALAAIRAIERVSGASFAHFATLRYWVCGVVWFADWDALWFYWGITALLVAILWLMRRLRLPVPPLYSACVALSWLLLHFMLESISI